MTRGKLDLGNHKLAGLYRPQARVSKHRRKRMPKMPGGTKGAYFMIWRIVGGAVRDTFERHPDYLTAKGKDSAMLSITKRVTGALTGYASQVSTKTGAAQCRSVQMEGVTEHPVDAQASPAQATSDAAANQDTPSIGWRVLAMAVRVGNAIAGRALSQDAPGGRSKRPPKFTGSTP